MTGKLNSVIVIQSKKSVESEKNEAVTYTGEFSQLFKLSNECFLTPEKVSQLESPKVKEEILKNLKSSILWIESFFDWIQEKLSKIEDSFHNSIYRLLIASDMFSVVNALNESKKEIHPPIIILDCRDGNIEQKLLANLTKSVESEDTNKEEKGVPCFVFLNSHIISEAQVISEFIFKNIFFIISKCFKNDLLDKISCIYL